MAAGTDGRDARRLRRSNVRTALVLLAVAAAFCAAFVAHRLIYG